jgi:hypothetical protein
MIILGMKGISPLIVYLFMLLKKMKKREIKKMKFEGNIVTADLHVIEDTEVWLLGGREERRTNKDLFKI